MPSKAPAGVLEDIRRHIELARSFVEGFTFEGFQADRRTVYAVIRCLEIISEASRRLPDDLKARIRKFRGQIWPAPATFTRAKYEDVADDMVWRTVQDGLGPLLSAVNDEPPQSQ
jgi:uncharacterized protein with HEPN domain